MATQEQKTVAFVLYPGLTLLDLVGPLQVFASLRRFSDQYRAVVVAERLEPMPTGLKDHHQAGGRRTW
jgi:transcriptional regulator GlxA family with amidase domain